MTQHLHGYNRATSQIIITDWYNNHTEMIMHKRGNRLHGVWVFCLSFLLLSGTAHASIISATALTFGNFGYAAAISYVLLVLVVIFATLFLYLARQVIPRTTS